MLWIVGYLVGTTTHVTDLILGGVDTYSDFPMPVRLFWTSLTIVDPVVVILLLLRRQAGVVLGVTVIVIDVAVNATVYFTLGGLSPFGLLNQTLFGLFVLATARSLSSLFTQARSVARQ